MLSVSCDFGVWIDIGRYGGRRDAPVGEKPKRLRAEAIDSFSHRWSTATTIRLNSASIAQPARAAIGVGLYFRHFVT
jgi:hypothetical protein